MVSEEDYILETLPSNWTFTDGYQCMICDKKSLSIYHYNGTKNVPIEWTWLCKECLKKVIAKSKEQVVFT